MKNDIDDIEITSITKSINLDTYGPILSIKYQKDDGIERQIIFDLNVKPRLEDLNDELKIKVEKLEEKIYKFMGV